MFEICKDVDELREKVQEARRVKMLHCPSKVDFTGLLCYSKYMVHLHNYVFTPLNTFPGNGHKK
jgi:hypothetical protein